MTTSNAAYLYDPPLAATGPYGAATSLNQYPTVGSTTYSYTPNDPALLPSGAVTSDGVRAFFYDEKGNLTKARQGLESAGNFDEDRFDALGVRWFSYRTAPAASDPSRIELTDGLRPEVVWELHSTTAEGSTIPTVNGAQYYVLGPNPDERLIWINGTEASVKARYPHTNRRGDTIAMGRDGIAETKFKYGPFGESADSTAGYPYRFTGQRLNSWTGLYHFKARAYAPGIGRFLQPDPIGYGDGPNIYAYVGNDPYNATDPTGASCVAQGETVHCDHPESGVPSVSFPRPAGWPDEISQRRDGLAYHFYNWIYPLPTSPDDRGVAEYAARQNPTPGNYDQPASVAGTPNDVGRIFLQGHNPVLSYVRAVDGGFAIVNVTLEGHELKWGYIVQYFEVDSLTGWINYHVAGEGNGWTQMGLNPGARLGEMIVWGKQAIQIQTAVDEINRNREVRSEGQR